VKPDAVRAAVSHEAIDGVITEMLTRGRGPDGLPPQITCGRGCAACCSEPVYVERQEVLLLARRLLDLPEATRQRVLARTRAWVAKFRASPLLTEKLPHVLAYRALRMPCPLLENQECLLYQDRPNACRMHMAIGPREKCEDDAQRLDQLFVSRHDLMIGGIYKLIEGAQPGETVELVMEHLGLLLAEALLGERVESGACEMLRIQIAPEEPEGAPAPEGTPEAPEDAPEEAA